MERDEELPEVLPRLLVHTHVSVLGEVHLPFPGSQSDPSTHSQKIDSMDVLLFIMYVYECPEKGSPNEKTAYISYLDSIRYLTPSRYRKPIYQEVVLSYFAYVKQRGFKSALIWVCPPKKGDDYIMYLSFLSPLFLQLFASSRAADAQ